MQRSGNSLVVGEGHRGRGRARARARARASARARARARGRGRGREGPEQLHLSAAAAVTALACTVRVAPDAPPGTAGVVVLPSAPKASATMTLSLRSPLLSMMPLSVVFFWPWPKMVLVFTPSSVLSAT